MRPTREVSAAASDSSPTTANSVASTEAAITSMAGEGVTVSDSTRSEHPGAPLAEITYIVAVLRNSSVRAS